MKFSSIIEDSDSRHILPVTPAGPNFIIKLPLETLSCILSYIINTEQLKLRSVCTEWNSIIMSTSIIFQPSYSFIEMCINNKFMSFDQYANDPILIANNENQKNVSLNAYDMLSVGYSTCICEGHGRLQYLIKNQFEHARGYYNCQNNIQYCLINSDKCLFDYLSKKYEMSWILERFLVCNSEFSGIDIVLNGLVTLAPKEIVEEVLANAITRNDLTVVNFLTERDLVRLKN